ncbi:MAG: DUF493 domain-containing protein [Halieaceae bacterium]|jgi:putative lipoic acid-binding regulatory protein|nr:DUF493 domain-containing protein [Halieaceae bacterium]
MQDKEAPKIEFPCRYPIKVVGRSTPDYATAIRAIFERHTTGLLDEDIVTKSSRAGTFDSITFTITATGTDQLEALHKELVASGRVSMVI